MAFGRWWSLSGVLVVVTSCTINRENTGQADHSPCGVGDCETEDAAVHSAHPEGGAQGDGGGSGSVGEDGGGSNAGIEDAGRKGDPPKVSDDAGREGGDSKPVSDDSGTSLQSWDSEASVPVDAGKCLTESAVAALPEDEQEYVADGDSACMGNEGCTNLPELWMRVECGDGDQYHCVTCRDEVCVELEYVVECSTANNWQPDGGE